MPKPLEYLYFIVAVIHIYAIIAGNEILAFITKPLLMIILVAFYWQAIADQWNAVHKLIVVAFGFSWVGDVALMFVPKDATDTAIMGLHKNPNFFLVGLVGFLITHVLYAVAFNKVSDNSAPAVLRKRSWILVPLVIYMIALLSALVPSINGSEITRPFLVPVLVYSTAIATMVVFAVNRFRRVNDKSFAFVFGGALLFMFSDSIIAINKFMQPFQTAGIFIMVLYISGQYFIARGCLEQFKRQKNAI